MVEPNWLPEGDGDSYCGEGLEVFPTCLMFRCTTEWIPFGCSRSCFDEVGLIPAMKHVDS